MEDIKKQHELGKVSMLAQMAFVDSFEILFGM